jgi:ubiquinone/menaquinone biosynthesis C-methylase UbiE
MGRERWQVAGSAAQVYQERLVPAIFEPWAPQVVQLAGVGPGDRVLDVACGTGVVTRLAAQRAGPDGRVVGLDLNPAMLEVAVGLPVSGAPVTWRQSSAEQLPFPAGSFDVVCCQLGLQFFADRPAALREMARVLARGGRLVAMVWRPIEYSPGFAALAKALDRHVGAAAGALMRAPFALGDEDELRALVETAGFTQTHIRRAAGAVRFASARDLVLAYGTGSPLAAHLAGVDDATHEALVASVESALGSDKRDRILSFPIEALLLSAVAPTDRERMIQ